MNENIDLTKILKDCPKGTKLYSTVYGEVEFEEIGNGGFPVKYVKSDALLGSATAQGLLLSCFDGECTLFPSKEQRDWSKFTAPWLKKERFDPKMLKPFDKVLVRDENTERWKCAFYSHKREEGIWKYSTTDSAYTYCIPYNNDTKYLLGTIGEAPEFYKYWED